MKKILFLTFVVSFFFFSCEKDESKNPLATIVGGQFASMNITKPLMDIENINNTSFGGVLTTPSNNIVKYDLYVRYTSAIGFTNDNYVLYKSYSVFPFELNVTPSELATVLNKNISEFKEGDKFRFLAYSFDKDGKVSDYNNLSSTVRTQPSMKQAYKFVTQLEKGANLTKPFDNYGL